MSEKLWGTINPNSPKKTMKILSSNGEIEHEYECLVFSHEDFNGDASAPSEDGKGK